MANPSVSIDILLKDEKFRKDMADLLGKVSKGMKKVGTESKVAGNPMMGAFKGMAAGASIALGVIKKVAVTLGVVSAAAATAATAVALWSTKVADSVEKAGWKFGIVFKETQAQADKVAKGLATAFGRHVSEMQTSMSRIGDILKPEGIGEEAAIKMSAQLTALATNAEEWTNGQYNAVDAANAFSKALVGEREMLKEMGIIIREADVTSYIENMGWAYNEANKMAATFNLILSKSHDMQAAVGTRMQSWTERVKQLKAQMTELWNTIGKMVAPVVKEIAILITTANKKFTDFLNSGTSKQFQEDMRRIAQMIRGLSRNIAGLRLNKMWEDLKKGATAFFGFLKMAFDLTMDWVGQRIGDLGKKLGNAIATGVKEGLKKSVDSDYFKVLYAQLLNPQAKSRMLAEVMGGRAKRYMDAGINTSDDFTAQLSNAWNANMGGLRRGRESAATGAGFSASRMGQQSLVDQKEMKRMAAERTKLLKRIETSSKTLNGRLEKSVARTTELMARRKEYFAPKDRSAQLVGMGDMYSSILQSAAGKKGPDFQIERNTRQLAKEAALQNTLTADIKTLTQQQNVLLSKTKPSTMGK